MTATQDARATVGPDEGARECPICGLTSEMFAPGGLDLRPDVMCPGCGSLERHRLVWLYALTETDLLAGGARRRLLHVAPAPSLAARIAREPLIDEVAADIEAGGEAELIDLTEIRHPDGAFDVIWCNWVLDRLAGEEQALAELFRVLAPDGWAILQAAITSGTDHADRLAAAGFQVTVDPYARRLGGSLARRFGLPGSEIHLARRERDRTEGRVRRPIDDLARREAAERATVGRIESIGSHVVRGWVWTPAEPGERVFVRAIVDGIDVGGDSANRPREALARSGIGDGRYGFRIALPASAAGRGRHHLRVEAVGGDPLPPAAEFAQEIVHSGDPWYVIDVALPAQPSAGYSPQPPRRRRSSGAAAPAPAFHDLPEARIVELTDYVIRRTAGLDDSLLPYGDPAGKDVLVFGAGYGADTLWATQRQARSILSTDVSPGISPVPFERALERLGIDRPDYEFRRESVHETVLTGETFDLIISRDVFEHVHDLKGTLASFRPLLRPGGRIAIYADSLWYSSLGGHIHAGPWEHLYRTPWELREELTPYLWDVWCNKLNRMTITDFVEAIRSVGLIILQLRVIPDPNIRRLPELLPRIRERMQVTPTDLSILSIGCELCFEENL